MAKTSHGRNLDRYARLRGNMLFVAVIVVISCDGVLGGRTKIGEDLDLKRHMKVLNKPAINTIKSEDGDIIDCVDIYKQPAFDHPLLKNHSLQMRPSNYPKVSESMSSSTPVQQMWQYSGSCPEGTVPIRRTRKRDLLRVVSFQSYGKKNTSRSFYTTSGHENVAVAAKGEFYGVKAQINVWNLNVEPNEFSASKVTILSGGTPDASSIQAGWMVDPQLYGDAQTRFYAYWTGDGFNQTGCFNVLCPGFVQVSKEIALGATISPLSTYAGPQYFIELMVYKDPKNKNWWLIYGGTPIGYWPTSIFKNLQSASIVEWGGEILNTATDGHHTTTQMGSGHFPSEGFGKSGFFRNILVVDPSNTYRAPESTAIVREKPSCYDLTYEGRRMGKDQGYYFYYGGPGRGPNCP